MRKKGTVLRWDSQRAFGFIRSPEIDADIFFHLRDYGENKHPVAGLEVTFDEIHVGGKGPRALKVEPARNTIAQAKALAEDPMAVILPRGNVADRSEPPHKTQRELRLFWASMGLMGFWALLWLIGIGLGRFAALPVITSLLMLNLATFYLYFRDKQAAQDGEWRVSENQLHGLALLGGWPGAWFGQQILRHKSSKVSFRIAYWGTVALNVIGLLAWLIWPAIQTRLA